MKYENVFCCPPIRKSLQQGETCLVLRDGSCSAAICNSERSHVHRFAGRSHPTCVSCTESTRCQQHSATQQLWGKRKYRSQKLYTRYSDCAVAFVRRALKCTTHLTEACARPHDKNCTTNRELTDRFSRPDPAWISFGAFAGRRTIRAESSSLLCGTKAHWGRISTFRAVPQGTGEPPAWGYIWSCAAAWQLAALHSRRRCRPART